MTMFIIAILAGIIIVLAVTVMSCVTISPSFGVFAVLGITIGVGAAAWARRAV